MNLLLLGASTRSAAFSALRAGLSPWCVDLFADRDLRAKCPARRLRGPYPTGFLDEIRDAPPGPWLYTGGLENHPFVVGQLADRRTLWGNDAGALMKVRNAEWLAGQAKAVGLSAPRSGTWPPGPGRWIVKPVHSGGGRGVRLWSDDEPRRDPGGLIVQEFIEGVPLGVVFCGATLLGATRQLIGADWLGGGGFLYCGSVGPVTLPPTVEVKVKALAGRLGLRGLFGIDGMLDGERFWPVEVNPRYTASVEVLEHATGVSAMGWHRAVFERSKPPPVPPASRIVAKGILYARRDMTFPDTGPWLGSVLTPVDRLPEFADIPDPGTEVRAGDPVMTLFAEGADEAVALQDLLRRAEGVGPCC